MTLSNCNYFLTELHNKRAENINSMSELIKELEEIVMDESNIIRNGSTIALKHVATGKYLTSIKVLRYTTGSKQQLVCLIFFILRLFLIKFYIINTFSLYRFLQAVQN